MKRPRLAVYAIVGEDDYLRRVAWQSLVHDLLGAEPDPMALAEFDGKTAELATVLDECRTGTLMAPYRVVQVVDADPFVSAHRDSLEKYIGAPSPCGTLVLQCRTWTKTWRLHKALAPSGGVLQCEAPSAKALPAWLVGRAESGYGCKLTREAAERLAELVGRSMGVLDMELAKLATFVAPEEKIGVEAVETLVGASREEAVFGVVDAMAERNARSALVQWAQVLATDRAAPFRSVGGLASSLRRLAHGRRLAAGGKSPEQAAATVGSPYFARALARQMMAFSVDSWEALLVKLLRIDVGGKLGLGDVATSIEKLVVETCNAR